MFSSRIVNSARFLTIPPSSQALYFHLGLRADDDGIVEAFSVLRLTNSVEGDLKALIDKNFVKVLNNDLVCFITDWREHNLIRADRKVDSIYKELLIQVVPEVNLVEAMPRADTGKTTGRPEDRISKVKISKDNIYNDMYNYEAVDESGNPIKSKKGERVDKKTNQFLISVGFMWRDLVKKHTGLSESDIPLVNIYRSIRACYLREKFSREDFNELFKYFLTSSLALEQKIAFDLCLSQKYVAKFKIARRSRPKTNAAVSGDIRL